MSVYPRIAGRLIRPTQGMIELGASLFSLHGKVGELLPLERVLATAFHKEPDRVPVVHFLLGAARRLTGTSYEDFSRKPEEAAEAYLAATQILGGDALYNVIDLSVEAADFGQKVIYPPHSTAYPDYENPLIATPEDYERLEVFDPRKSPRMSMVIELGRILAIDGITMLTEWDEAAYHEMIAHVPLLVHPKPSRILIVGGGDGGTVREVLKHPEVERVRVCEIDEEVVHVCRKYLPNLASAFDDPRVKITYGDGAEYVSRRRHTAR